MNDPHRLISDAFRTFLSEAPDQAQAWGRAVQELAQARSLDAKTAELAYIAVLAALRITSGIAYHVRAAKGLGASRQEIIDVVLVGLPAAGSAVT